MPDDVGDVRLPDIGIRSRRLFALAISSSPASGPASSCYLKLPPGKERRLGAARHGEHPHKGSQTRWKTLGPLVAKTPRQASQVHLPDVPPLALAQDFEHRPAGNTPDGVAVAGGPRPRSAASSRHSSRSAAAYTFDPQDPTLYWPSQFDIAYYMADTGEPFPRRLRGHPFGPPKLGTSRPFWIATGKPLWACS